MEFSRVLVLIDFENIKIQAGKLNRRIQFPKLVDYLTDPGERRFRVDAYLYATLPPENGDPQQRYYDHLRHEGLIVVTKRAKRLPDGSIKGNVDSLLILDAMELALTARPDVCVLVTGDGDYAPLAMRLRRRGIRVEAACGSQGLANELKTAVNGVVCLDEFYNGCELFKPSGDKPPRGGNPAGGHIIGTESVFDN